VHEENFWTRNNFARCDVKFAAVFGTGYRWTIPKSKVPSTFYLTDRIAQAITNVLTPLEVKTNSKRQFYALKHRLLTIAQHTDLFNTQQVTDFILGFKKQDGKPASKGYKLNLVNIYAIFCKYNQIPFDRPQLRVNSPIPIIPSTTNVNKIIANGSRMYAPIFKIMAETAIEGQELTNTHRNQIDTQRGSISVIGVKDHTNGIYVLRQQTADMLRGYLAKHPEPYPFPQSRSIGKSWEGARARAAKKLCEPELLKIPLKNLRNYAGAIFYYTKGNKDPFAVMKFMRHRRISTTQDYLRGMIPPQDEEYTHKTIQLGTPTTIREIEDATDAGYKLASEANGYQIFVKLKPLEI
jgi:integrase